MLTFIYFFCNICVDVRNNRYAALVKRLRRSPLTAESRVRFPDAVPRYKSLVSVGVSKAYGVFICYFLLKLHFALKNTLKACLKFYISSVISFKSLRNCSASSIVEFSHNYDIPLGFIWQSFNCSFT